MADSLETRIQIAVDAADAAKSVGDLKSAIRELEGIAATAGESNKEAFLKAAQEAGRLKDQIEDARDAVSTFKGDPLESMSKGIGSLKGRLMDLDFKGFSEEVGRLKTVSKQVTFKELAGSVGETAGAFLNLGKILLTNPIFLIASVIGLVVSNFDKLTEAGGFVGAMFNGIKDAIGFVVDGLKSLTDAIGLTGFAAQETAEKQKKVIEDIKAATEKIDDDLTEKRKKAIDENDGNLQKAYEAEKARITEIMKMNDAQIAQYDALIKSGKQLTASQMETYNYYKTENEKMTAELADFEKKATEDAEKKAKERADNAKRIRKEQEDVILALEKDSYKARLIELDRFYADLRDKANGNKDLLLKIKQDESSAKAVLDDQEATRIGNQEAGITAIKSIGANTRLELTTSTNASIVQSNTNVTNKSKEEIEKQVEYEKQAGEQRKQLTIGVLDALINLNSMFEGKTEAERKKAFNRNKALQIAQALIQTYQSATAAYSSQLTIPTPDAPIRAAVAAGIAVASGLAQVAKIAKTNYQSSGGGTPDTGGGSLGGGLGSSPSANAPTPTIQAPQLFTLGQGILQNSTQQGPNRVVVLENDITRTQNRVRVIENRATIG